MLHNPGAPSLITNHYNNIVIMISVTCLNTSSGCTYNIIIIPRAYKRGRGYAPHVHSKIKKRSYK